MNMNPMCNLEVLYPYLPRTRLRSRAVFSLTESPSPPGFLERSLAHTSVVLNKHIFTKLQDSDAMFAIFLHIFKLVNN